MLAEASTLPRRSVTLVFTLGVALSTKLRLARASASAGTRVRMRPAVRSPKFCPGKTSMVFVPSVNGLSHNIAEFTGAADLQAGADVLLQVVLELARPVDPGV